MGSQVISTGMSEPLPHGTVDLLLGSSSFTLKSLQVLPGVINAYYTWRIEVMVQSIQHIIQLSPDSHIIQMFILSLTKIGKSINKKRGFKGFGSSDMYWVEQFKQYLLQRWS